MEATAWDPPVRPWEPPVFQGAPVARKPLVSTLVRLFWCYVAAGTVVLLAAHTAGVGVDHSRLSDFNPSAEATE